MKIIPEALALAKLQRTSQTEKQIILSYETDLKNIKDCITDKSKILDIGCGIAGVECLLSNNNKIYLIDKTQTDKNIYYGYKDKTSFYNSLEIAKQNLIANGIQENNIFTQEAEDNKILFKEEFDLIISLISCGFHYPIETYLDQIYNKLKMGGTLIINIRKGTTGIKEINKRFGNSKVIREELKFFRIHARK